MGVPEGRELGRFIAVAAERFKAGHLRRVRRDKQCGPSRFSATAIFSANRAFQWSMGIIQHLFLRWYVMKLKQLSNFGCFQFVVG